MSSISATRFPADHPTTAVRGRSMLQPTGVRQALKRRIEWIAARLHKLQAETGRDPYGPLFAELAALVQALETFETIHPPVLKVRG